MATISADNSANQAAPERAAEGFRAEQLRLRGNEQGTGQQRQSDFFHTTVRFDDQGRSLFAGANYHEDDGA